MTSRLRALLPGILVAATGVGAGDLVTASLAGSELGLAILWAAVVGAVLKGVLTEGLARWQLATGDTLLEGWVARLGRPVTWVFLPYLCLWSFIVGGALVNACGIAATALLPIGDAGTSRIVWGVVHSLAGLALVRYGGFALFERAMALCIGIMFACVTVTAVLLAPEPRAILEGLTIPRVPAGGTAWVVGVLGGVGGTVTMLSYGYWIREHGRRGRVGLTACRIDLSVAYAMTALFGVAMIIIGSQVVVEGSGAAVAVTLADRLESALGPLGRWIFLAGFWGAVFSSLLGVWQSVPYLFADLLSMLRPGARRAAAGDGPGLASTRAYRLYQLALALAPLPLLATSFRGVQLAYAVCGALFMPFLAITLLVMNNRTSWVGSAWRNGRLVNGALAATVLYFGWEGARSLAGLVG